MSVLLIGVPHDPHLRAVEAALRDLGRASLILTPTALLQGHHRLSLELSDGGVRGELHTGDARAELTDLCAVYNREYPDLLPPSVGSDEGIQGWLARDSQTNWDAALSMLDHVPWIGHPDTLRWARCRATQLRIATRCGLRIPRTAWTNLREAVRHLQASQPHSLLAKPLHSIEYERAGTPHYVWTTRLSEQALQADRAAYHQLVGCYQTEVPRTRDWRIVALPQHTFAAEVHCAEGGNNAADLRDRGVELSFRSRALPAPVVERVQEFLRRLRAPFAVIDLLEDAQGDFWFLEANINGNWMGFAHETGLPVAHTIARLLTCSQTPLPCPAPLQRRPASAST